MTIAIELKLKEDWGRNTPCVVVKARRLRGEPDVVAYLTPDKPTASVTITDANDLILEPEAWTASALADRARA